MNLYHYTSPTGAQRIAADGWMVRPGTVLIPRYAPALAASILRPHHALVWFTDLPHPAPGMIGFSDPDFVKVRLRATDPDALVRWGRVRSAVPPSDLDLLERGQAMPGHWWVSHNPVHVQEDRP